MRSAIDLLDDVQLVADNYATAVQERELLLEELGQRIIAQSECTEVLREIQTELLYGGVTVDARVAAEISRYRDIRNQLTN